MIHKAKPIAPIVPVTTVDLNGVQTPIFGNIQSNNLAVVDLDVLKLLTDRLPKANINDIKDAFIDRINRQWEMDGYINELALELRFHSSVNQITLYEPPVKE